VNHPRSPRRPARTDLAHLAGVGLLVVLFWWLGKPGEIFPGIIGYFIAFMVSTYLDETRPDK
jgi:hypothetical protein